MNEAIRHEVSRLREETGWRIAAEPGPMHGQVTLTLHDDDLRILVNKVVAAGGITELEREARAWMATAHAYEALHGPLAGHPEPEEVG